MAGPAGPVHRKGRRLRPRAHCTAFYVGFIVAGLLYYLPQRTVPVPDIRDH